jgi:hypothetical protein
MATPKHRPSPDAVSINGRRASRKSDVIQKPGKDGAVLETYEQNVERPGPDSRGGETPDGPLPAPERATLD